MESFLLKSRNKYEIDVDISFSINLVYGQSIPNLTVGYGDRYDSLPKLVFNTATIEDYRKAISSNNIVNKTPTVEGKNLLIQTGKGKLKFKKYSFSANQVMDFGLGV
jgi:hypothetical protein